MGERGLRDRVLDLIEKIVERVFIKKRREVHIFLLPFHETLKSDFNELIASIGTTSFAGIRATQGNVVMTERHQ